jgi:hypothetical protein
MNLTMNNIKYIYKMILYVRKLSTSCTLLKHTIHCHNNTAVEIKRKYNSLFLDDTFAKQMANTAHFFCKQMYHILVDNIAKILPCDKTLSFV